MNFLMAWTAKMHDIQRFFIIFVMSLSLCFLFAQFTIFFMRYFSSQFTRLKLFWISILFPKRIAAFFPIINSVFYPSLFDVSLFIKAICFFTVSHINGVIPSALVIFFLILFLPRNLAFFCPFHITSINQKGQYCQTINEKQQTYFDTFMDVCNR